MSRPWNMVSFPQAEEKVDLAAFFPSCYTGSEWYLQPLYFGGEIDRLGSFRRPAWISRLPTISHINMEVIMVSIWALWLPILLSAVIVFVASSLIHMVFRYHAGDFRKFPNEDAAADALRKLNIPTGRYMLPHAQNTKEMKSPEFQERVKRGPGAILTIWPGGNPSMAVNLTQWFLYSVIVGILAAYVAGRALGPDAHYLAVFRFAGVTAFTCYAIAGWQESIWFKRSWSVTLKNTFDGLVYALLTAGTFGWLWPR
jgi:hypothetical protein